MKVEKEYRCKQSKHSSTVSSHVYNGTADVHIRVALANQVPKWVVLR
jgi:hypothetical protein